MLTLTYSVIGVTNVIIVMVRSKRFAHGVSEDSTYRLAIGPSESTNNVDVSHDPLCFPFPIVSVLHFPLPVLCAHVPYTVNAQMDLLTWSQ